MKQILRSLCTLLMLVVWASGFAQEVTLDFTNSKTWNLPLGSDNIETTEKTYSNGTYSITINASVGHFLVGDKENNYSLLLGKKYATLTLPAFDFDVEKIVLKKSTQKGSEKTTQNIYVGSTAVSTQTTSADKDQTYEIKADYQKAGNIYVLKVTNANNTQFSKIEIYKAGPSKTATTLDFGFTTKSVNINETFTAPATLKTGETAISGAVTYTSSNTKVANVDANTGLVLAYAAGKTTITATFAGTSEYKSSTASYVLTVVDPNAPIANIVFDKADDAFGALDSYNKYNTSIGEYSLKASDGNLYVFKTNGGKTANVNGNLQLKKTSGSLESPVFDNFVNGYVVNVTFSQGGTTPLTITSGGETKNADISDGAGDNTNGIGFLLSMNIEAGNNFMLKAGNAAYISKIEIIPLPAPLTLSETDADTDNKIANNNGKTVDVTLTRTLTAGAWNTICLPFDVTVEQMADVLNSTVSVKEYESDEVATSTIKFKDATTMQAGVPYLIKLQEGATIPTVLEFKGVTIKNVEDDNRKFGSNYKICGTFGKYTMKTDGTELFLKTDGKFYIPAAGTATMKGFRAYFYNINGSTASAALNLSFGEATGIDGVAADAAKNVKIYNVNGQYVGTSLDALPKGLYIVGGKKVLK